MTFDLMTHDRTPARCEDGKVRTFHQTAEADTFFSVPGFVYAAHRRVYGFLTGSDIDETDRFIAYRYRKNHELVKAATDAS